MSADTWQRVRSEYEAGLEVSPETRAARLAALREAGESELANEVGALWTADGAAGSFLAEAAVVESDPVVGTSIGPIGCSTGSAPGAWERCISPLARTVSSAAAWP